jgi:flagellin
MGFQQGFRINTNTSSLDTYRNYSASQAGMEKNIERLSSGLRINSASDDSAGLSISNRMDNQVRGMQQAHRNVQQGNNLLQTAEGAMNEISNMLGRMRELAVQSASDTVNLSDRDSLDQEFTQLTNEINRIASATEYNDQTLLATDNKSFTIQVTADYDSVGDNSSNVISFTLNSLKTATFHDDVASTNIDLDALTLTDASNAATALTSSQTAIGTLDDAIASVNKQRGTIGALQNRLESTSSNLMNSIQNNAASMSTIRDADFAAEAADLAKNQILVQSGTAMLAQANGLSQNVLALIR